MTVDMKGGGGDCRPLHWSPNMELKNPMKKQKERENPHQKPHENQQNVTNVWFMELELKK